MSAIRLGILGLLMESESHPYEIRQKMKDRGMHHYIKLQDGSLYYAIEQLNKEGFIRVVDTIKDSGRPDRTVYAVTDEGREQFQKLLLKQFAEGKSNFHPIYAALRFAHYGDQGKICELLEAKIAEQEHLIEFLKQLYEEHIPQVPLGVLHLMMGGYEHAVTELRWLRRLARDAKAGKLKQFGIPLDLSAEE